MRYDFFIIWGNGINYTEQIVEIISHSFRIVYEKSVTFADTSKFIKEIYGCDKAPLSHLIAKSKYLHKSEKRAYFVLVENDNPKPQKTKTGSQCDNIQKAKIKIRNKFNPKFKNSDKKINPLGRGVSHEHVIHASDYESQTEYVLNYLGLPGLDYFQSFDNSIDIRKIIKDIPYRYVVIKMNEDFPNYKAGSDIDIMCDDVKAVSNFIKNKVNVKEKHKRDRIHLDYFKNGKLNLKFDLINGKKEMFDRREKYKGVYAPCLEDELKIREAEFKKYPHKKHHKKYIDEKRRITD